MPERKTNRRVARLFLGGLIPRGWGEGMQGRMMGVQESRSGGLTGWGYAVLAVFHLCLLRLYFPSTNLVDRAVNCYICHSIFISPLFLCFFNLEFQNLSSVPSALSCVLSALNLPSYSFLLFFLFPVLFSLSVYSFSDLPYCFLFKSFILSFFSSYYSILSAASSPLCSITIPSVLFLF